MHPLFNWVIPENIHTLPWAASWNSKGEGIFWTGILKAWGVIQFQIPNTWGREASSEFLEGKGREILLNGIYKANFLTLNYFGIK